MFGVKEYMNDNDSVASVETYYSHDAVSDEIQEEEEEVYMEEEYDENYYMNEVPYKTKPVEKETPKIERPKVMNTKIPEVNPWCLHVQNKLDEKIVKSISEIMEEEKEKEEMLKKKKQEEEERRSKFKRKKYFNFKNNQRISSNGRSMLLDMKRENIKK